MRGASAVCVSLNVRDVVLAPHEVASLLARAMRSRRVEITLPPRATERSVEAVVRGYGSVEVRLASALPRPGISTPPHQRGCRRRSTGKGSAP